MNLYSLLSLRAANGRPVRVGLNALKYGSLSLGVGFVDLDWRVEGPAGTETLHVSWRETKGPKVERPTGSGFGSRLIGAGISSSGNVEITYDPAGLVCEISAPLDDLRRSE